MDADVRLARRSRRTRGLVTHQQCLACGLDDDGIAVRLAAFGWRRERNGVYSLPGATPSWEQTLLAVVLPFDDCWISHGTAARLWDHSQAPEIDAIEVLRPYGRFRRLEGVVAHRSRIITPADVTTHRGIPVTSRARTIVECSGRLTVAQTGRMLDEAIRRDKRQLEETRAAFARLASGGNRRTRTIRAVLARRLPGYDPGESDLELRALNALTAAGLPMPAQQFRIVLNGKRRRIDLAYPDLRIAIELLGWEYHGGRERWDDDHARANELTAIDWRHLEFTSTTTNADMVRLVTTVRGLAA